MDNYFTQLAQIDVSKHVEKKGQFSYLSWPFAVQELGKVDPAATWKVERFNGLPYLSTDCGVFVEVSVTCKGVTKSQLHPVLDQRNQPIKAPNAFQINTSIQRALVKAIALHGLGLYIYAGEDLPDGAEPQKPALVGKGSISPTDGSVAALDDGDKAQAKEIANSIVDLWGEDKKITAYELFYESNLSNEMKLAIWEILKPHSSIRNELKKMHKQPEAA